MARMRDLDPITRAEIERRRYEQAVAKQAQMGGVAAKIHSVQVYKLTDRLRDLMRKPEIKEFMKTEMESLKSSIIANAPVDLKTMDNLHLKDSFKTRVKSYKFRNTNLSIQVLSRMVGTVRTSGKRVNLYAARVEFGRRAHTRQRTKIFKKKAKEPYSVTFKMLDPNPFMRNTMIAESQGMIDRSIAVLVDAVIATARDKGYT